LLFNLMTRLSSCLFLPKSRLVPPRIEKPGQG
jgi:hypothetical protein